MSGRGISAGMVEWIGTFPRDVKLHPCFREVINRHAFTMRTDITRYRIIGEVRAIAAMEELLEGTPEGTP